MSKLARYAPKVTLRTLLLTSSLLLRRGSCCSLTMLGCHWLGVGLVYG